MKLTADGFVQTNLVDGTTLTGLFNEDGSLNIVLVDGTSVTGLYHACGAYNVVQVDGLTPCGAYAPCGALNVIVGVSGTTGRGPRHASGAFLISSALSNAFALLSGEDEGLAFDFTDQSAYIKDTGTPANDYNSTGIVSSGELVGPSGKLTYTSPSNKLTRQADGYYKYQAHNLCTYSEEIDNGAWGKNGTPTITANADGVAELWTPAASSTQHWMRTPVYTAVAGVTYVFSVRVKPNGYTNLQLFAGSTEAGSTSYCNFVLSGAGSKGTEGATATGSISAVGDGYYDLQLRATMTGGTATAYFYICAIPSSTATRNETWTPDGVSGFYVTRAHHYRYPANTDYIKTTSAAKYALPMEYDTSGNCLGLLVEEQRTNLLTYATTYENAAWVDNVAGTGSAPVITDNAATAPDGTTTAATITLDLNGGTASGDVSGFYHSVSGLTAATAYTGSTYVKGTAGEKIGYRHVGASTYTIHTFSGDWERITVTETSIGTSSSLDILLRGNLSGISDTVTFDIWVSQLEQGSFPTSPIITYGSALARAADNISILTSAFPYNQPEGTVYSEFVADYTGGNSRIFSLDNGVGARVLDTYYNAASTLTTYNGTNNIPNISYTDGSTTKIAAAYKTLDYGHCANGSAVQLLESATVNTATKLNIGQAGNATAQLCSIIKAISYVPRRKDDIELAVDTGYSLPTGYASYGAWDLFGTESSALAFDFTDQSVVNTKTPLVSQGIVSDGELVGPGAALTYTSPSNKLTRQSDGYYKYQAHNFAYYSEDFSQNGSSSGFTVTSDNVAGPPGFGLADKIEISSGGYLYKQSLAELAVGGSYTVKCWMRADSTTTLLLRIYDDVVGDIQTAEQVITSDWTLVTWPSCAVTAGASSYYFGIDTRSGVGGDDAAKTFYAIGTHVHRNPANTDYIRTTTAAKYALPLEYDTGGNCLGLLVEEAKTNTQLRSTNIALAAGYYAGAGAETVTANAATSPSGLTDASSYVQTGVTARIVTAIASGSGHSIVANSTNTFSIFAKKYAAGTNHWLRMTVYDTSNSTNQYNGWFNLNTGAIGSASSGGTATGGAIVGMKDVGNGWYRCSIRGAVNNSATFVISQLAVVDADTSTTRASGDGCYLWGWQFEAGSFPTSPIITYGSATSRLVDNIKIAITAMPWSSTAMSSMAKWTQLHPSSGITSAIIGADGDYIIYTTGTAIRTYDGTSVASSGVAAADNTTFQAASSFENGVGQKITVNGETTQTASFDGTMGSGTSVWIGNRNVLSNAASKIISKILMVPRAKTTAELESDSTQ